jgi:hypothetical protein
MLISGPKNYSIEGMGCGMRKNLWNGMEVE